MSRRRSAVCAGFLLGVLLTLVLPAAPASAHATLLRSDPPANTVVDAAPAEIQLTFSEPVRPVIERIRVVGPDGRRADGEQPTVEDGVLRIPLREGASPGTYLVSYRVISSDSHPVAGGITFSIGAPSALPSAADRGERGGQDGVNTALQNALGVARFVSYAGLVMFVGPVIFLLVLWPSRLARAGPVRLALAGAGLLTAGTLVELYLQVPYASGGGVFDVSSDAVAETFNSAYGAAHLLRLAIVAAAVVMLRPVATARSGRIDRVLLGILAVAGLATWPFAGHAAASPMAAVSILADAAHLGAMAVWLGGLLMLATFVLRRADSRELSVILPVWSGWAELAVIVLVVAGAATAIIEVRTFDALVSTMYGRLILVKIGLVVGLLVFAWLARRIIRRVFEPIQAAEWSTVDEVAGGGEPADDDELDDEPDDELDDDEFDDDEPDVDEFDDEEDDDREGDGSDPTPAEPAPEPDPTAARRIRVRVLAELAIAVIVVAVAAALVQTTPARTVQAASEQPAGPFAVTLTSSLYHLQIDVDPATVGLNNLHMYAFTPAGQPLTVLEWKVTLANPDQGLEPVEILLVVVTKTHAVGQVNLPSAGTWELRFTLRTSDIDQATVSQRIPIP